MVYVHHSCCSTAPSLGSSAQSVACHFGESCREEEDDKLDAEASQEGRATAETVDERCACEGAEEAEGLEETGHPADFAGGGTGSFEERARVGGHGHDARVHHEEEGGPGEDSATGEMKTAGVTTAEPDIQQVVALVVGEFDDGDEFVHFVSERWIVEGDIASEFGEDLARECLFAVADEPTGGFRDEPDSTYDDHGGEADARKWEAPDQTCVLPALDTVEDPVDQHDAEVVGGEDDSKGEATIVRGGEFGDPGAGNRVDKANTDTGEDTAADEHVGVVAAGLECTSEKAEQTANEDTTTSAEFVTGPAAEETSEHCRKVVDSNQTSIMCV